MGSMAISLERAGVVMGWFDHSICGWRWRAASATQRRTSAPATRLSRFERLEDRRMLTVTDQVLTSFGNLPDGADPVASLTLVGSTLYGTTTKGGADNDGTIFSVNPDGSDQVLYSFTGGTSGGANPYAGLTLVGSTLYGTTYFGGSTGDGTVFSINTDGSDFQVLYSFTGGTERWRNPYAGLTLVGSTLYGTTAEAGSADDGTVFSINTDGTGFQVLHSFAGGTGDGEEPTAGLTLVGSTLYGTTLEGGGTGAGGDGYGTVYSINTDGTGYQVLHSFTDGTGDGGIPEGVLALNGSTLYGTTYLGGSTDDGAVFSINADGTGFQVLHSFTAASTGLSPEAGVTLVGSALYGSTNAGGSSGHGTIFSINTDGTGYQVLHSFTTSTGDGDNLLENLTAVGATLFGTTEEGGSVDGGDNGGTGDPLGDGTIFSIGTDGAGYQVLHSFSGQTPLGGASPVASLTLVDSALFGTLSTGGDFNFGTAFSIDTDGADSQLLHTFGATVSDGDEPLANMTLIGSTLYGTTRGDEGTVFSINTNGTDFQVLHSFTGSDGEFPAAGLTLVGSTLYGTTEVGGSHSLGTVFSINTNGTDFQVLHSFAGGTGDGSEPTASLTLVGSTLYGTTTKGGSSTGGTVFSIATNGTGYTVLHSFTGGTNGAGPAAGLTLVGSTLFGTTEGGGFAGFGNVFSINTDGTDFTVLHSFTEETGDGEQPDAGLTLVGSSTLYGTTYYGGSVGNRIDAGFGTVFSIGTDGTGYQELYSFAGGTGDGDHPAASLTLAGSTLYGTTAAGGAFSDGTVFSIPVSVPFVAVTPSGNSATYTLGGPAVAVDPGVMATSNDGDITGATMTINNEQTGDTLNFTSQNGITGSYNSGTGALTLTGSATPAQYQAALESVAFSNSTNNPSTTTRSLTIAADAGSLTSNSATESVNVAFPAPVVTASGSAAHYTAGPARWRSTAVSPSVRSMPT